MNKVTLGNRQLLAGGMMPQAVACFAAKKSNFVANAAIAYMGDAQTCDHKLGKSNWREVSAARLSHQTNHFAVLQIENLVLQQKIIDCGVKKRVVLDIVDVSIDVVVMPPRGDEMQLWVVAAGASFCFGIHNVRPSTLME